MPTRRTLELVLIAIVASRPIFALARVWAHKTLADTAPGGLAHGAAEIVSVAA